MQTSLRGKLEILSHEGVVLNRYRCPAGVWTIGPGITRAARASVNPGTFKGRLTVEQCVDLLGEVLPRYEATVNRLLGGRRAKQHEYDALVSLAYNAGDIAKPLTTRKARSGDIPGAINLWRADRILWGRRDKEVKLARDGIYSAKSIMTALADHNGVVLRSTRKFVPVARMAAKLEREQ